MAGVTRKFSDQSGAQRPDESLVDFKKRIETAVEAGTYVAPTRSEFGAGVANTAIDLARKITEGTINTPVLTPTTVNPPTIPTVPTVPITPVVSTPATTSPGKVAIQPPTPAVKPWYTQNKWGVSGQGGKTPLGEQPTATRVTRGINGTPTLLEAQGITELTKSPEQIANERNIMRGGEGVMSTPTVDYNAKIEDLVNQVMNAPSSRVTQSMGGGVTKTGGIKKSVLGQVVELRKAQLGLQGQQITAAVTREGHGIVAKERIALERDRLAETKRYNDIRAEDVDLKRRAELETKLAAQTLKNSDSFYKSWELISPVVGSDETGKPIKARDVGLLDILDSGQKFRDKVPDLYPAAQQVWDRRELQIRDAILALKGGEYKPEDINKPGTKTYKYREMLKKKYREALLNRYAPKP